MKMLIGRAGQVIARIAGEAGEDLANVFLCDVRLKITVKVKK
uniref:KH type-2 domain-containing protein n=1 Tax=Anguilla anguilla TaxID=7936 RepID=A0A0E9U213_ANGAN